MVYTNSILHLGRRQSPLLQFSAGVHGPHLFHCVAADAVDLFVEVDGDADVVGDHVDAVAHVEFRFGVSQVDEAVLFVHFVEARAGGFHDRPKVTSEELARRSEENVLEPPSMIIWPGRAVETTVARMVAAQSSSAQAPLRMVLRSLKT